jgi:glycosyltransferase involved in cell wall biosynthesis
MAHSESTPFVTIAVPCFNEEHHIEAFLDDVAAQDYPASRMEILIGDGMSTDRTREILARIAERMGGRLRVIDNPRRLQAAGMNQMIAEAKGDVIVRMDVHARYAKDFVSQCIAVLKETGAQNVGGPARPLAQSWFQRAVCAALESKLAVGGSSYRNLNAEGWVDTVFPGAFPREVFETVGGFDGNAITNEDAELNQRILEAGGKVYLSQKITVHYFPRDTLGGLAKQYFKYGKGRARTLLKHKTLPTPRPTIPFFMVIGGTVLLATSPFQPFTPFVFGAYGAACSVEALRVSRKYGLHLAPVVAAIFPVLHVCHGVGFGAGLVHYLRHPDWESNDDRRHGRFPAPAHTSTANGEAVA